MMNPIRFIRAELWRRKENQRRRYQPWFGRGGDNITGTCPNCAARMEVRVDGSMRYCPCCGGRFVGSFTVLPRMNRDEVAS